MTERRTSINLGNPSMMRLGIRYPRQLENVRQLLLLMRKQPESLVIEDLPDNISGKALSPGELVFIISDNGMDLEKVKKDLLLNSLDKNN
jgi:hypothetical protein